MHPLRGTGKTAKAEQVNADDVVCGMRRAVMGNDLQLLRWVSLHSQSCSLDP